MKRYVVTVFTLGMSLFKRFLRDKTALFFTFLFPLLFLFVFGSLNKGSNNVNFDVAFINRSDTRFAQQFMAQAKQNKVFKFKDVASLDEAKERMGRGEIDSIIELPKAFGQPNAQGVPSGSVVVYFEQASPDTGQTVAGIIDRALDGINQKLTGQADPLVVEQKATQTLNLSRFDYIFAGLLGFTMLSLGVFGMANGFPVEKKQGILRRLKATPLRATQLVGAVAIEYLLIALLSISLMFIVGLTVFHFNMRGDYLSFGIFVILSTLLMFGFGLLIGGWAKNENQAAPLSNLVAFPLMFLSGTFFPRFLMPEWLQNLTAYLPLTPIIDGLRYILTEGKALLDLGPELLIMAIWMIVVYTLAVKLFRWE